MSVQTVIGSLGVARPFLGNERQSKPTEQAKPAKRTTRTNKAKAERKASLRVINGSNAHGASMAMRITGCAVLGIAVIFGLIAFHVVLSQGQFRLAELQQSATTKQAEYQRLRLQVAELEAPANVANVAQNRLGMVVPSSVTAVTPKASDMPKGLPVTQSATVSNTEFENWMTVKPHVALSLSE